jgi:TolA-binding protein
MQKILAVMVSIMILGLIAGCGKMADEKLMQLGKQMEEDEKFEEAAGYYAKLVKMYPESPLAPEALHNEGKVYANGIKDYDKAVAIFGEVVEDYPNSAYAAPSQFMIGFVYANSEMDTVKAREAYEKFIQMYPDHELVPSVEFELKYLGKDINDIPELMNVENK